MLTLIENESFKEFKSLFFQAFLSQKMSLLLSIIKVDLFVFKVFQFESCSAERVGNVRTRPQSEGFDLLLGVRQVLGSLDSNLLYAHVVRGIEVNRLFPRKSVKFFLDLFYSLNVRKIVINLRRQRFISRDNQILKFETKG